MRQKGGNSGIAATVHRPWADSGTHQVIVVHDTWKANGKATVAESPLNRDQFGFTASGNRDWAAPAMMRPNTLTVSLDTLEIRLDIHRRPFRVAELHPGVKIGWAAPQSCGGIDA